MISLEEEGRERKLSISLTLFVLRLLMQEQKVKPFYEGIFIITWSNVVSFDRKEGSESVWL